MSQYSCKFFASPERYPALPLSAIIPFPGRSIVFRGCFGFMGRFGGISAGYIGSECSGRSRGRPDQLCQTEIAETEGFVIVSIRMWLLNMKDSALPSLLLRSVPELLEPFLCRLSGSMVDFAEDGHLVGDASSRYQLLQIDRTLGWRYHP